MALLIWMFPLFLWIAFTSNFLKAAGKILQSFFWSKLTPYFLAVVTYVTGIVYLLFKIHLWDLSQLKNTVLWYFTVGVASLFHITDKNKSNYLNATIKDVLSLTAIIQFIIGVYSFSLFVELILIPFVVIITGMVVVAESNKEHHRLIPVLRKLTALIGLILIFYSLFKIISDFKSLSNESTLTDFLVPAVLSFLFLPMLYIISIVVTLDDVFTGIDKRIKYPELQRYARWKTLLYFHVNKNDLYRWRKLLPLQHIKSRNDIDNSIQLIKEMKRNESNPVSVNWSKGWSPYSALLFLKENGVTTGYYQPATTVHKWMACSKYLDIDDNTPASNISYYVEGDATVATKLTLSLSVYNNQQDGLAVAKFLDNAVLLFKKSLYTPIPIQIEDSIINGISYQQKIENRNIIVEKQLWENKAGGYTLNLIIQICN
ncbi:hypothetical protein [Lacibacter sp.]|uniref:hypothetical protein n=1 Tax=Lacibacter sp. TaxID=1915409 RepID=UPI002B4B017E|nr:hypothetical protein [Lacibacter sp.]HLP37009.1 hypothetical protein [Lacibacter sp.]